MIFLVLGFWLFVALFTVYHFRNTRDITLIRWGIYDAWWSALHAALPPSRDFKYLGEHDTYDLGCIIGVASIVIPLLAAFAASIYFAL